MFNVNAELLRVSMGVNGMFSAPPYHFFIIEIARIVFFETVLHACLTFGCFTVLLPSIIGGGSTPLPNGIHPAAGGGTPSISGTASQ